MVYGMPTFAFLFEDQPRLVTDRLVGRRMHRADAPRLHADVYADPAVSNSLACARWTRSRTQQLVEASIRHWRHFGFGLWVFEPRHTAAHLSVSDAIIGIAGLESFGGRVRFVAHLQSRYWGRGLATEVGREALAFGHHHLGLETIVATPRRDHDPSLRVVEKCQMTRLGPISTASPPRLVYRSEHRVGI